VSAPGRADPYRDAFLARCRAQREPGQEDVRASGLHGLTPSSESGRIALLVTDDRALPALADLLGQARAGTVNVFAGASRCTALLEARAGWLTAGPTTAMVRPELSSLPNPRLPAGLTIRAVARLPGDPVDAVPLEDAAALVVAVDPMVGEPPEELAAYLRSLPAELRLLAAVDAAGAVRATGGGGAFGLGATVVFISTDTGWRGRGVATAMTAAALRAAREAGATRAVLDASDAGRGIYTRLGFEAVARTTRYWMREPDEAGRG
jgi:ribosomal protein S18 acetylase RimI-like enzyme